ncbi:uncharacterized protein LOC143275081 [Babylonia areolata]|uniref:uncharacterized protein LOC143275081 n=1 Tax=Babylonia areolata TaxID=304850 RepID=UPI003FD54F03
MKMVAVFWMAAVFAFVVSCLESSAAQTNAQPGKPPALSPRRHFSWQRLVHDEPVQEKAFAVDNPDVQVVALISRDPQLGEAQFFGSVSMYDFSTPKPVAVIKPHFQGQPCFLLPPPEGDFNSTLALLDERNGAQANVTGQAVELTAGDLPLTVRERAEVFAKNPVVMRLCYRQAMFRCTTPDPLAFDPYLAAESEQLTFSVLTLESSVTITFTWEAMTR